jgi:anti-anti-sigma regulatory factor
LSAKVPKKSIISAACYQSIMYIHVEGLGSMNNSNGMYSFLHEGFDRGFRGVCLDLGACDGMDSTFMGTLLLIHEESVQAGGGLLLINLSDYNRGKLEELGVAQFLKIGSADHSMEAIDTEALPAENKSYGKMALVLKAHEELVQRNADNGPVFNSFIAALKDSIE